MTNRECIKCGGFDVNVKYKPVEDEGYTRNGTDNVDNVNEFVKRYSEEYTYYDTIKEHLLCTCKICGYKYAEKCLKERE